MQNKGTYLNPKHVLSGDADAASLASSSIDHLPSDMCAVLWLTLEARCWGIKALVTHGFGVHVVVC